MKNQIFYRSITFWKNKLNIQKLNVEEILNTFQKCDDLKRNLLSKIESFLQKEKWLTYKESKCVVKSR